VRSLRAELIPRGCLRGRRGGFEGQDRLHLFAFRRCRTGLERQSPDMASLARHAALDRSTRHPIPAGSTCRRQCPGAPHSCCPPPATFHAFSATTSLARWGLRSGPLQHPRGWSQHSRGPVHIFHHLFLPACPPHAPHPHGMPAAWPRFLSKCQLSPP